MKQLLVWCVSGGLLFSLWGCRPATNTVKPELLVYCGITMIRPVSAIAKAVEKAEDCKIIVTKGGSGNLLKSIEASKAGDLYLPGSASYIKTAKEMGIVDVTALVGYNKAAMMVQKGNPRAISDALENLTSDLYYVVIGNPDSGSIGRETKKVLERAGIYEQVLKNVRQLTTDSKDLVLVLKEKRADLVINWYATAVWPENSPYVDVLPISDSFATPKKLILGRLVYSKQPELAKKFIEYAASEKGQALFRRYGFLDVK